MSNPFKNRVSSLSGPATDMLPITPTDGVEFAEVAIGLFVENGGSISLVTARGGARVVQVAGNTILPLGVRQINATGTSATGIHAMVIG